MFLPLPRGLVIIVAPGFLSCAMALAQPVPASDNAAVALEPIVVVGSRAAEPLQQVVGSVSVVERDRLERMASSIATWPRGAASVCRRAVRWA